MRASNTREVAAEEKNVKAKTKLPHFPLKNLMLVQALFKNKCDLQDL